MPTKLTDTQLIILSAAAQRQDHAVVLRPDLKAAGSRRAITTLIKARLLEEMRARREMRKRVAGKRASTSSSTIRKRSRSCPQASCRLRPQGRRSVPRRRSKSFTGCYSKGSSLKRSSMHEGSAYQPG
jgi:hypothetical protein